MSILKHIFYKLIAIFFTLITCPIHVSAVDFYAKVDFIGNKCSGKTVLYNLLTEKKLNLNKYEETKQIDFSTKTINLNSVDASYNVKIYFNDTPSLFLPSTNKYSMAFKELNRNTDIMFACISANDYIISDDRYGSGVFVQNLKVEETLEEILKINPKIRIIVVLTQLENIRTSHKNAVSKLIKNYIHENIFKNEKFRDNIDAFYDISLSDNTPNSVKQNYIDLILNTIKKSLSKRIQKRSLPTFELCRTAKLSSCKIIDELALKFLSFTLKEEVSHIEYFLDYGRVPKDC